MGRFDTHNHNLLVGLTSVRTLPHGVLRCEERVPAVCQPRDNRGTTGGQPRTNQAACSSMPISRVATDSIDSPVAPAAR